MKVLQKGTPGGAWTMEIRCSGSGNGEMGCGALLEINAADLFHTQSSDYTGDTDHYVTFECPECNEWTDIKRSAPLPNGLRSKIVGMKPRSPQSKNKASIDPL